MEEDYNTRFFHNVIYHRRSRNQINKLLWNNKVVSEPEELKRALFHGFKDFYCASKGSRPLFMTSLQWQNLSLDEADHMTKQFTKEEIWISLQESDSRKASGLDGLNAGWIKKLWPQISDKVLSYFKEFHDRAHIPQGANSSFIVLIPKKTDPSSILDFRLISLINSSLSCF